MVNENPEPVVLRGAEASDLIARLIIGGVLAALALALIGVVQGLRYTFTYRYVIFVTGGVISSLVLLGLPLHAVAVVSGKARKPSFVGMLVSFGGFIPYLLGVYLVLYEGLWRLSELRNGFAAKIILVALVYGVLGFILVKGIDRASSFARKVDTGRVVLR